MESSSKHDNNFKEQAILQVIDFGCSIEDVAKKSGICEMTLYQWTKEYMRQIISNQE